MLENIQKTDKGLLKKLLKSLSSLTSCEDIDLKYTYRLKQEKVRLPRNDFPMQAHLNIDATLLYIFPELGLTKPDKSKSESMNYLIFNPKKQYKEITGFIRLHVGDKVIIGLENHLQADLLRLSSRIGKKHLTIQNKAGRLLFQGFSTDNRTCLSPVTKSKQQTQIFRWRIAKLKRLSKIFGEALHLLNPEKALQLIHQVNAIMERESFRLPDRSGAPGGVVKLADNITPVIIGDLHTKIDNLLVILSHNGFLEMLAKGKAALIILGDAVHSEETEHLEQMQSSMMIMDLIFKLKCHFPKNVFYLRGNHDSFSPDLSKQGVPQGLLWKKELLHQRGELYLEQMQRFYQSLPTLAWSKQFITCHAAPPLSQVTLDQLININSDTPLLLELINNRVRLPQQSKGYGKRDIKNLRKTLGVGENTPVIVGHTPLTSDESLWLNAGKIPNHHIIYDANHNWVPVFTTIKKRMIPLHYPCEPLLPIIQKLGKAR